VRARFGELRQYPQARQEVNPSLGAYRSRLTRVRGVWAEPGAAAGGRRRLGFRDFVAHCGGGRCSAASFRRRASVRIDRRAQSCARCFGVVGPKRDSSGRLDAARTSFRRRLRAQSPSPGRPAKVQVPSLASVRVNKRPLFGSGIVSQAAEVSPPLSIRPRCNSRRLHQFRQLAFGRNSRR